MVIGRKTLKGVRYRILALLLVPLLSVVTAFTPTFSQNASALTANDVLNRARAWSILNSVIDEIDILDSGHSNTDVGECDIWGDDDDDGIWVGHHVTGDNGDDDNSTWEDVKANTSILNGALASVGIEGGCRGLLEALGFTYKDGDMIKPSEIDHDSDDARRIARDRLNDAVDADAFFGAHLGDAPHRAMTYAILYYYLENVCGWDYRNPFVPNDKAPGAEGQRNREAEGNGHTGTSDDSHYHTYTYEAGKAGDNTYFMGSDRTDGEVHVGSRSGIPGIGGQNNSEIYCSSGSGGVATVPATLAKNTYLADAYATLIRPGGQYTDGTCGERFNKDYSDDADLVTRLLAACDEGYKNRAVEGFCEDKYPLGGVPDEHRACAYGHDDATGGANDTTPPEADEDEKPTDETSCAIQAIGWIVCPVMNFMAGIVDGAYAFVASMLTVQPLTTGAGGTDEAKGIFTAWEVMRNFANICFIIAFLIIVFSQVTSAGITNYGIKKMLPRLVVAAILVNVSYWICAIAVDLSNIFGVSLKNLFDAIAAQLILPNFNEFGATAEGWLGITGAVLAGAAITTVALFVQLTALLPVLVTVLFAIVTVFIVLMLRQAIIILLIVISPLAFVAFLLPNTEGLFKKWRQMFQVMLLVFPIISLIFGASALASKIVMGTADGPYAIVIQIMGAGIAIIPLFITPIVMKISGGVLNRVGGIINNQNKGPFDRMRKGAERVRDDERNRRRSRAANNVSNLPGVLGRLQGSSYRRQARRKYQGEQLERDSKREEQSYVNSLLNPNSPDYDPEYAARVAGASGMTGHDADPDALARVLANAVSAALEEKNMEIKAAHASIDNANLSQAAIAAIAGGGQATDANGRVIDGANAAVRAAAMQQTIATHNIEGINQLLDDSANGTMDAEARKDFADALANSKDRPAYINQGAISEIRQHGQGVVDASGNAVIDPTTGQQQTVQANSSQELVVNAVNNGTYSIDKVAKGDKDELTHVATVAATDPGVTAAGKQKLKDNATTALTDTRFSGSVGKNRGSVETLSNL